MPRKPQSVSFKHVCHSPCVQDWPPAIREQVAQNPQHSGLPPSPLCPPPALPRLQLVGAPWGLHCAGLLEFYAGGLGGSVLFEALDRTHSLKNSICEALQCGSFVKHLPEDETARALEPGLSQPLPIRWRLGNASCDFPDQCFIPTQPQDSGWPLALLCSGE